MALLTVNGITFEYPDPGTDQGWGAGATDWASEVTSVLSTLLGPNDILETSFNINNNQTSSQQITKLFFDSGSVRAANIQYSVYRRSDENPSGNIETGMIYITYDNSAVSGSKWIMGSSKVGESGIIFTIDNNGQFSYTSTDIGSTNYTGIIKFSAKALSQ